jgi:hypothetical protein
MQSSAVVIGNSLIETGAGLLDQAGFALTLNGDVTSDGGIIIDNTGAAAAFTINNTTLTMSGDAQIDAPATIANNNTLTLASNSAVERTLLMNDQLTLDGTLALGSQDINFINGNDLFNVSGAITSSATGIVLFSGGGNNIEVQGNQLDIPNLTLNGATTLGAASNGTLRVVNNLVLNAALTEADVNDVFTIADLALITMNAGGSLAAADPTFQGLVSIIYNTVTAATGNEVPDAGALQNLTINAATTFDQDFSVAGILTIGAALNTTSAAEIGTLLAGATLRLTADNANVPAARLSATNYILEYAGGSDTISNNEFLAGATVTTLIVNTAGGADIITLDVARTVNNLLLDNGELEMAGNNLSVTGDLTFAGGNLDNDGAQAVLAFTGGNNATLMLAGDYVVDDITVRLDKTGNQVVTLAGPAGATLDFFTTSFNGDLEVVELNGGILETTANTDVFLFQSSTTQGFTRTLGAAEESHIAGNVTKRVFQGDPFSTFTNGLGAQVQKSARFEFPTGSPNGDGPEYRPVALTFRTSIPTQTDVTVNHEDVSPGGVVGLPVADDTGLLIGSYPPFYWLFRSTISLGQAQQFDVELTGTDINLPAVDDDDLRIIRRFDGDETQNEWSVQGLAANYDNFLVSEGGETTAVVRVTNSAGGLVPQGARFTIGIPTQAPVFTAVPPGDALAVDEGEGVTFTFTADPQDLGETVTFSLQGAPDFVTIDPQTGVLTAEPGFTDAGVYTFQVIADDGSQQTATTVTLTVNNVNRAPEVTPADVADQTIPEGVTFTIDFNATDVDPGDDITFSLADAVENAAIDPVTGVFTFTPSFDQAGETFAFTVNVSDGTDVTAIAFNLTVEADVTLGDADQDNEVTPLDAAAALQHAAGFTSDHPDAVTELPLTGEAFVAADVSGNGQVTAFDAALILQFLAGDINCFPADDACVGKAGLVAVGDPSWGQFEINDQLNLINLPINLTGNVENVYSLEFTTNVDVNLVNFKQVSGSLPKDWQISYSFNKETGMLKIAAAGATPLNDAATVATVTFEQLDKNSKPVFAAEGFVNENALTVLAQMTVVNLPKEFSLGDNYPNPFNPSTMISYALPQKAKVTLEIYDVSGRLVQTLVNQEKEAGRYTAQWDGRNAAGTQVASGLYVYRINAGSFVEAKTMLLVK